MSESTTPPTKPRRTRLSAADRRATILAAAAEVFSEAGYQRGKMSEVARRVGVSEPVVFQNFGSKAALFAAVLDDVSARLSAMMRERAQTAGSTGAWLAELLSPEHLGRIHARGTIGVLFSDAMSIASEPAVDEAARRATRTIAETLTDLLAQGHADGTVRSDLAPDTGAWWLLSLLASQAFRFSTATDRERVEADLGAATLLLLTDGAPGPDRPAGVHRSARTG